jgi:hypothetical protein
MDGASGSLIHPNLNTPAGISSREVWGLAMAVWTEEPEILDPIVVAIAIDVVESHGQRSISPPLYAAALAAILLQAFRNQTTPEG